RALGERRQQTQPGAGVAGGVAYHGLECVLAHVVRTRERRQHAARLEQPDGAQVDLLVTAQRAFERAAAAREGRWVEHDQAEALAGGVQAARLVEGVGVATLGAGGDAVEREIVDGARQRVLGRLDTERARGPGQERLTREARRVREDVEHPPPGAQRAYTAA